MSLYRLLFRNSLFTRISTARLFSILPIVVCLSLATVCQAQQGVDNAVNTGLPENGVFHGSDVENVQINNGNLHVEIPVWSVKGRGLGTSSKFVYDNKGWYFDVFCDGINPCTYTVTPLLANNMILGASSPLIYQYLGNQGATVCKYNHVNYQVNMLWSNNILREPNGTKHHFSPDPIASNGNPCWESGTTAYADDGSGWILQLAPNGGVTAVDKHGTVVTGNLEDSNGNELLGSNTTDTLGRSIQTTSYSDSSGTLRNFVTTTTSVPIQTHFCQYSPDNNNCFEYTDSWTVPSKITLPNNQSYSFTYVQNAGGEISSMTLPSGAQISWTYVDSDGGGRVVSSRMVTVNGVSSTWNYSYTHGTQHNITSAVLTDAVGNDTAYTCLSVGGLGHPAPCYISSTQYYQGSHTSGTLLKTVATDYVLYQLNPKSAQNLVLPIRDTTTWNPQNLVRKVETDWDTATITFGTFSWQNPLERREYDWGTGTFGALLKRTHYNYLHLQNSTYLNKNIADRDTSVVVYDGSSNTLAQTTTTYDGGTLTGTSGAPNHDYTNFSTSNQVRGNPTTVSRWVNPGNTWLSTTNTFDDLGNLLTTTDPAQHTTTFSYTDNWANSSCVPSGVNTHGYVTQVTNALNQNAQAYYYPCTGLAASHKDQNDINAGRTGTTFQYDLFGRLTQKNTPDGGQTTVSYNDAPPISNTTTTTINSTQNVVTTKIFDGLGRLIQSQLTSDPQGAVFSDTTYDLLGRVSTVSNPYRSGSDITTSAGTTTYGYDALSRKTSETYPDSSVLTTAYCGSSSTLVTDPTGKWRRSRTDGLGRLVEVDEPNAVGASVNSNGCPGTGEPIWVTSYTYDALGDLTNVLQNGSHARTFSYDSLSRLLTSNNPEAGTITYKYDSDTSCASPNSFPGLLVSKTDARAIRACSQFDAINRETVRNYSNGDPTITITFDQSNCLSLPRCDNVGHRTGVTDAAGSENWAFDVIDRFHKNQRTTSSVTKSTTYNFDLAGNATSVVYPTGRTVNYSFDSANRPSTATDGSNGITYATGFKTSSGGTCLANVTCYTPQGSLYALSIGQTTTFTGLNLTETYNNRLQPLEIKASSSAGNAIDVTYSFVDPTSGKNAGHVSSVSNNLDTTRSQTFTYDQLNRITGALTASTHATSPTHCWGETYTLDAWGNLNQIAATTNSAYTGCSQESGFTQSADGNNHLPGFSYDASGNTQNDGTYTYAWDGESQLKSAGGVNYLYDGAGRRVAKVGSKLYWYGSGGEILAETDSSGNTQNEYIFFGGKRVALIPVSGTASFYAEDLLGTSRVITTNAGVVCYDADFYPFGGERPYTNTCPQNYKFEGKERDTETGNDDFGARYYSNRFGRWLSSDWSSVPVAIPYAVLSNPQTLNLYAMVAEDPESFADLDGHLLNGVDVPLNRSDWQSANSPDGSAGFLITNVSSNGLVQALTVEDLKRIVDQALKSGADPTSLAMQIFNNLGTNVTASGADLREALARAGVTLPESIAPIVANAQQISKSGSTVTIQNSTETKLVVGRKTEVGKNGKEVVKDKGNELRIAKTVSFNVGVGKGTASLTNMSGLSVWKGITWLDFHDMNYTNTGQGTGNLDVHVGGFMRHYSCSSGGCVEQK